MKWYHALLLVGILIVAAALRLSGIDWDNYNHYHPDERYITWVATTVEWPAESEGALDPVESSFNPFYWPANATSEGIEVPQGIRRSYAYGHVPLYLGVMATRLLERVPPAIIETLPEQWLLTRDLFNRAELVEFRHLTAVSRALTALIDVGTVALTFFVGRRLYGVAAGLLAAAFLAVNVMHIQLAHFFTVDPYLTFFIVAAILAMLAALGSRSPGSDRLRSTGSILLLIVAAIFIGLAVGSKFSAGLLFLPLATTLWFGEPFSNRRFVVQLLGLGLVAFLAFALSNPFAVLDWGCDAVTEASRLGPITIPAIDWRSCYLQNVAKQGAMVRGSLDAPFARQYDGTLPFLYYLEGQIKWGMGPLLGISAFVALGWALWRAGSEAVYARKQAKDEQLSRALQSQMKAGEWVVLAWVVPYFLITGLFFVKFMRYMQPLTPFLMIYAAAMLLRLRPHWLRRLSVATILVVTTLYALSFVNIYSQEHPWIAASRWLYRNAPAGSTILSEQWDEGLPTSLEVDGTFRRRFEYQSDELTWLTGADGLDNEEKLTENLARMAGADYLTLTSNRVYGVVPRIPERYPLSSQYHALLFDESLGYELVYVTGRFPGFAGYSLKPDTFGWPDIEPPPDASAYLDSVPGFSWGRADESILVYDQPLTMIFANTGRLSAEEMQAQFRRP